MKPQAGDWGAHWAGLVAGRDEQRGTDQRDGDPVRDPWRHRAERFAQYSADVPATDPLWQRLQQLVQPDDTVLDVGAGAGRYTVPLAQLARQVLAVEPSPAMRQYLAVNVAAAGLTNVTIIAGAWPLADPPTADLTLCSHVVYGVRAITPFLQALDAQTRRLCLLAIRVDQPPGVAELARALFAEERVPQPALLDLYGALLDLGIAADVQIVPTGGAAQFATPEAAVMHFRDRLRVSPDSLAAVQLRDLVQARLVQGAAGQWSWPTPAPRTALVSWPPADK